MQVYRKKYVFCETGTIKRVHTFYYDAMLANYALSTCSLGMYFIHTSSCSYMSVLYRSYEIKLLCIVYCNSLSLKGFRTMNRNTVWTFRLLIPIVKAV